MGCGFSRRVVPNSSDEPGAGGESRGAFASDRRSAAVGDGTLGPVATTGTKDSSLSFIVPIRDQENEGDGSIIRRYPPIRLRRLEEEQQVQRTKLTLEDLERRQAEAEERRRRILDSRVQSAQHFQRKVQQGTGTATSTSPTTECDPDEFRDGREGRSEVGGKRPEESS